MTTTVTKSVKSAGGDYTTWAAYEAANQADLTSVDEIRRVELFGLVDTAGVTIDGWTTDVNRYIECFGTSPATLPYTSSLYRLEVGSGADLLVVVEDYVRIRSVTLKGTASGVSSNSIVFRTANPAGTVILLGCVLKSVRSVTQTNANSCAQLGGTNGNLVVANCVGYDDLTIGGVGTCTGMQAISPGGSGIFSAYNNLIYGIKTGYNSPGNTSIVCKNCMYDAAGVASPTAFSSTGTGTDYNASTQASAPGAHSRSSQTFTYVDAANGDFHLGSADAGAKDFGLDLSADATYAFSTDFDGFTRSGSWDIGPTEVQASSGQPASKRFSSAQRPGVAIGVMRQDRGRGFVSMYIPRAPAGHIQHKSGIYLKKVA